MTKELWQTWCMRRTENPENVVRIHEVPPEDGQIIAYFRMDITGSNPVRITQFGPGSLVGRAQIVAQFPSRDRPSITYYPLGSAVRIRSGSPIKGQGRLTTTNIN